MRAGVLVVMIGVAGCATPHLPGELAASPACMVSESDTAWLSKAPGAWRLVSEKVLGLPQPDPEVSFVLYDKACIATGRDGQSWTYTPHSGEVALPDGGAMPAIVTSFAAPLGAVAASGDAAMMVMALPSVWQADGVSANIGLETLMFAVFAHEMAHTRQFPLYNERLGKLGEITGLGDDLTDDVIQNRFRDDTAFVASIKQETELLYQAAEASEEATARRLAKQAFDLLEARRADFLKGADLPLAELEDLFLTMEGAGQYAGFAWLSHASGAGLSRADAIAGMRRGGRWWSQDQGLAIFLALDRLMPGWPDKAFGSKPKTALALLAEAVHGAGL